MTKYNYLETLKEDIKDYIKTENIDTTKVSYDELYDAMFIDDSITGNTSGSYTCNKWDAEENICHNMDLLEEAFNEFGYDCYELSKGAEFADVTIRCYLLGQALTGVLEEMEEN